MRIMEGSAYQKPLEELSREPDVMPQFSGKSYEQGKQKEVIEFTDEYVEKDRHLEKSIFIR